MNIKSSRCTKRYVIKSLKVAKENVQLFLLQPIFLNELSFLGENDGSSGLSGNDAADNSSKTLRLRDQKRSIILLASSPTECSLWSKRIAEARWKFVENEKTRLQRQRSSMFNCCNNYSSIEYLIRISYTSLLSDVTCKQTMFLLFRIHHVYRACVFCLKFSCQFFTI